MHALQLARQLIEKADRVSDSEVLVRSLKFEQLLLILKSYEQRSPQLRFSSIWDTLYSCVRNATDEVLRFSRADEVRSTLDRCACDLMRRQLSRAVVLFFECELDSVGSDHFPGVYRDKVARINFLVRKRMVFSGVDVRDQYDELFDKCVYQPLMRVVKPLAIDYPEVARPKKVETREKVSPPVLGPTTSANRDANEIAQAADEVPETSGAILGEIGELNSKANGETSSSGSATMTASQESDDPGASVGSESSNPRENITSRTEQVDAPNASGDNTVLKNKTSNESEQTEFLSGVSENATQGLESSFPVGQDVTASLDGAAATATSQESDLADPKDNEIELSTAVNESAGSVSEARGGSTKSEVPQTQTPTVATVATASEPVTSADSPPANDSGSSLFWVLLSFVALFVPRILLVLVNNRMRRRDVYQWLPLVDLDEHEPVGFLQVLPELSSSNEQSIVPPTTRSPTPSTGVARSYPHLRHTGNPGQSMTKSPPLL